MRTVVEDNVVDKGFDPVGSSFLSVFLHGEGHQTERNLDRLGILHRRQQAWIVADQMNQALSEFRDGVIIARTVLAWQWGIVGLSPEPPQDVQGNAPR